MLAAANATKHCRTFVLPRGTTCPQVKHIVIRNITRKDIALKIKTDAPRVFEFELDRLVIEPKRYFVLDVLYVEKALSSYQNGVSSRIYVFARPVTPHNHECLSHWMLADNCERPSQLAFVIQLLVSNAVYSAEKLVLDLPGSASLLEPIPDAVPWDDEDDCRTAVRIEEDTDTAGAPDEKDVKNWIRARKAGPAIVTPADIAAILAVPYYRGTPVPRRAVSTFERLKSGHSGKDCKCKMSSEDHEKLMTKVNNWLAWDKNDTTRGDIAALAEAKDYKELAVRMNGRLVFGTAGIRARMDAGFARLNDLTIIRVTHGFATHMNTVFAGKKSNGVAIGYDGRHNSKRFAHLAANVFIRNNIPVYLFSEVCPTPVVSWATVKLKCDAGLIITASHNPKEDNGYKAYWSNGAQIIGPHDTEIIRIAEEEGKPKDEYWDLNGLASNPMLFSADVTIDPYFEIERSLIYHKKINETTPLKITYSAFHGVGYLYAKRMFKEFGFPDDHFFSVKEQQEPDPDFPTVPFPNPEEGKKVLTLSFKTADANGSTVILANDPDADRIQLAEKQANGEWRVFTGNEMGTLLTWWVWTNWSQAHPDVDKANVYVINSAVSSQIVKTIADAEGFKSDVTLTGFKWMGNKADELRANGKHVILAWEESIGYMPGHTMDKDGISTAGMYAEMAAWLHTQGKTLKDQLFDIYHKYGFHLVKSSYWFVLSPDVTKNLFNSLRKDKKYPQKIGPQAVKTVRDLTIGYDNSQPGNKPVLPLSTSSEMITFNLADGSIATLRASGTEPKIKYYIELKTAPGKKESDLGAVTKELEELEKAVVETLLRPKQFGLIPRK